MVKIINAYADENTLTKAFTDIAQSVFGGNVAQQELIRQKAAEAVRTNQNVPLLADSLLAGDRAGALRAAVLSGIKPENLGGYDQYYTTHRFGPRSNAALTATMAVPGANYRNTIQGVEAAEANQRATELLKTERMIAGENQRAENAPINVIIDGKPVVVSKAEAIRRGLTPSQPLAEVKGNVAQTLAPTLTPEQNLSFIDAQPKGPSTVYNYVGPDGKRGTTDGLIDLQTRQPLAAGTQVFKVIGPDANTAGNFTPGDKEKAAVRQRVLQNQGVVDLTSRLIGIVEQDPSSVGAVGNARRFGQTAVDALNNVGILFGDPQKFNAAITQAQADAAARGIDPKLLPGLYNPNVSNIVKLNNLLAYQAAAALAGQSGRDLSNQDVQRVFQTIGQPDSWLEGPQAYLNGLRLVQSLAKQNLDRDNAILNQNSIRAPQTTPAPNAPAAPTGVIRFIRDADGNIVRGQ